MKKFSVWALLAIMVVAGSAFAAPGKVAVNETFDFGGPTTTNNDDSCDISVAPAATLLLPYFEVDITSTDGSGETTIFTITNVSALPQIAHVTLWTDWSFPVVDFNIFLTGYDVQSINLRDVIRSGLLAPPNGTGTGVSPIGSLSGTGSPRVNLDNPNVDEADCAPLAAPVNLGANYVARMQQAFTLGRVPAGFGSGACENIGDVHANAIGYATIDVSPICGIGLPTDPDYFTTEILFDNVLIGDYQQVNGAQNYAQGNPMVHIRAIPEGGPAGSAAIVNFDRTFYTRYTGTTIDRRQPLPALFAARWISGGATGFQTFFKIWREGVTGPGSDCSPDGGEFPLNAALGITEFVRFDEDENFTVQAPPQPISPPDINEVGLPETSAIDVANTSVFPPNTGGDVSGWMYMNLDNADDGAASQNWVIISMRAERRLSVDFDAAWLGNGCTPEIGQSRAVLGAPAARPGPARCTGPTDPTCNFNPDDPLLP